MTTGMMKALPQNAARSLYGLVPLPEDVAFFLPFGVRGSYRDEQADSLTNTSQNLVFPGVSGVQLSLVEPGHPRQVW